MLQAIKPNPPLSAILTPFPINRERVVQNKELQHSLHLLSPIHGGDGQRPEGAGRTAAKLSLVITQNIR